MADGVPLSPKAALKAKLSALIESASPEQPTASLDSNPFSIPNISPPFNMTQTEFAKKMNKFLESSVDSVQGLMDYVNMSGNWAPAPSTYNFTLNKSISPGDTNIHINLPDDAAYKDWVIEEDRNRIGIVEKGTSLSLSTQFLSYATRDYREGNIIHLQLEAPVSKNFIRDYYEQSTGVAPTDESDLVILEGTPVARFEAVRSDLLADSSIDVMMSHVETGLDRINNAVDTVLGKDQISIACCMLRQLAAISNAGAGSAVYIAGRVTPSEKVQAQLQNIRDFVVRARVIATFSMGTGGFSLKFMTFNIYKILVDSMLISLAATLNVIYRQARESIYSLAFGLLQRNRIVNCMPFYDLVRSLLAWLFSRQGIMGWLAGFTFQSVNRMRTFFQDDLKDLEKNLSKQINFEKLLHLLDSLIAATSNMELCQDILSQATVDDDITKDEAISPVEDPIIPSPTEGIEEFDDFESQLNDIFQPETRSGQEDISLSDLEATGADALTLIIQPSDDELERFMINRLGADPATARDAVYRSKMGECAKGLDPSELSNVVAALQEAGLEI